MSKKNNQQTRRNAHAYNLQREKEQREEAAKKAAKKAEKKMHLEKTVLKKMKKKKGIRIKKGVTVRGIKIKDSASKKRVLELLKAEQAFEGMDVEQQQQGGGTA